MKPSKSEFIPYYSTHTRKDTASHFKVPVGVVRSWIKEFGCGKDITKPRPDKADFSQFINKISFDLPDRLEFEDIYLNNSNSETATFYNVSEATIDRWRTLFDVPRKTNKWKDHIDFCLTDRQRSIVVGSLLGDGSLLKVTSNSSNSSFEETHAENQKEYLKWKQKELFPLSNYYKERLVDARIRLKDGTVLSDSTRKLNTCYIKTMRHPLFTSLEKEWYARDGFGNYILNDNGRRIKVVPDSLELNELIVAIWYFDDGSHNKNNNTGVTFNTQSFAKLECEFLSNKLKEMGFETKVNSNRGMPIIQLSAKSYLPFMQMMCKYLPHDCMKYKIDLSNYNYDKVSPKKLTMEAAIAVLKLSQEGVSDCEIAEMFLINQKAIQDIRLGRSREYLTNGIKVFKTNYLTDEQVIDIRMLAQKGISDEDLAVKYNRKTNYIKSIRLGIKRKSSGGVLTKKRGFKS